jgi:hypothetical protein
LADWDNYRVYHQPLRAAAVKPTQRVNTIIVDDSSDSSSDVDVVERCPKKVKKAAAATAPPSESSSAALSIFKRLTFKEVDWAFTKMEEEMEEKAVSQAAAARKAFGETVSSSTLSANFRWWKDQNGARNGERMTWEQEKWDWIKENKGGLYIAWRKGSGYEGKK